MKSALAFLVMCVLAFGVIAEAADFSIAIDAEKDAWYNQLTGPQNGMVHLPAACFLMDVGASPDDNADISATVWSSYETTHTPTSTRRLPTTS